MDVEELFEKKRELEVRLMAFLADELQKFREETGFSIEGVDVNQVSVKAYGESRPTFITGNVTCRIAF